MTDPAFLPGVPAESVLAALRRSPGSELASGKFDSPESSAALVANAFGWFLDRPKVLPPLPGVPMGQPDTVEIEAEMRLPWTGGRHPWLDAAITTPTTLVGVESKRFEPFRPGKAVGFSEAYDSRDWGKGMARFTGMRRALAEGRQTYRHLDAVQLVKHAYGLKTQSVKRARGAVLVYLYAEPAQWASGKPVSSDDIAHHRAEVAGFARAVRGDDVTFVALRWADLLDQWAKDAALFAHATALKGWFGSV
jgi:hypothetical protein